MLTHSDLSASPLFWETFWPVTAFALVAILCLISFAWFPRLDRNTEAKNL